MNISIKPLSRAGDKQSLREVAAPFPCFQRLLSTKLWAASTLTKLQIHEVIYWFFVQEPSLLIHWLQKNEIGMSLFSIIWLSTWHDLESSWGQSSIMFTRSFLDWVNWGRMTHSKWDWHCLLGRAPGLNKQETAGWTPASITLCFQTTGGTWLATCFSWHQTSLPWWKYSPTVAKASLSFIRLPLLGFLSQQREKEYTTSAALFPIVLPPPPLDCWSRKTLWEKHILFLPLLLMPPASRKTLQSSDQPKTPFLHK